MSALKIKLKRLAVQTQPARFDPMKANYESKNFRDYIAALKAHNAKVAAGLRTNPAFLWKKERAARQEMQAARIVTQEEMNEFHALTEAEAAK